MKRYLEGKLGDEFSDATATTDDEEEVGGDQVLNDVSNGKRHKRGKEHQETGIGDTKWVNDPSIRLLVKSECSHELSALLLKLATQP